MENFIDRYAKKIQGILSCFDRIILTGTVPGICYADGMSTLLRTKGIRIFDYTKWAEPLREEIRTKAEQLAEDNDLEIEFITAIAVLVSFGFIFFSIAFSGSVFEPVTFTFRKKGEPLQFNRYSKVILAYISRYFAALS